VGHPRSVKEEQTGGKCGRAALQKAANPSLSRTWSTILADRIKSTAISRDL